MSPNNRYLFLLSWIEESQAASGDKTNVFSQEDLMREFKAGNNHIFAIDIYAPNMLIAEALGYSAAFYENYTAMDSVSICSQIEPSHILSSIRIIRYA